MKRRALFPTYFCLVGPHTNRYFKWGWTLQLWTIPHFHNFNKWQDFLKKYNLIEVFNRFNISTEKCTQWMLKNIPAYLNFWFKLAKNMKMVFTTNLQFYTNRYCVLWYKSKPHEKMSSMQNAQNYITYNDVVDNMSIYTFKLSKIHNFYLAHLWLHSKCNNTKLQLSHKKEKIGTLKYLLYLR